MTDQPLQHERFTSVWDALEDTPRQAANMRLRSKLLLALCEIIRSWEISQKEAAKRLHISQPRLNDVLGGKIDKFSLDALVNLSAAARMDVDICFTPQPA
ncbi:MAG: hypothetical protein GAK37_02912 [Pseudomonas sp.]|nr:MAG: hypothetical protein GAK37_02912 [Pseudomonas sp.]